jgi:hypothetical protein
MHSVMLNCSRPFVMSLQTVLFDLLSIVTAIIGISLSYITGDLTEKTEINGIIVDVINSL